MDEKKICPVCGAVTETPDDPKCGACGFETAFVSFFSSPEAEAAWRAEAERRAETWRRANKPVPPTEKPVCPTEKPVLPTEKPVLPAEKQETKPPAFLRRQEGERRTVSEVKSPATLRKERDNAGSVRAYTIWKDPYGSWLPESARKRIHVLRINGSDVEYYEEGHRWTPVIMPVSRLEAISDYTHISSERDAKARQMRQAFEEYRSSVRQAEEKARRQRQQEVEACERDGLLTDADRRILSAGRTPEAFERVYNNILREINRKREWLDRAMEGGVLPGADDWHAAHLIATPAHAFDTKSARWFEELYQQVRSEISRRLDWIRENDPTGENMALLRFGRKDPMESPSDVNQVYRDMRRQLQDRNTAARDSLLGRIFRKK